MRTVSTRRTTIRRVGLATLLVAAIVALSGCYAKVYYPGPPYTPGYKHITIKKGITDQIIWGCTVQHGTGPGRAMCALDTIRDLCTGIPVSGVITDDCSDMGSYGEWQSMARAIEFVTGPNYDCLSFLNFPNDSTVDEDWAFAGLGSAYCE